VRSRQHRSGTRRRLKVAFIVLAGSFALAAGSWQAAGAAAVSQPAKAAGTSSASCVSLAGIDQSDAQAASWTPAQMRESIPFSQSALAKAVARLTPAQRRAAQESARQSVSASGPTGCADTGSAATSASASKAVASSTTGVSPQTRSITSGYRTIGKFFFEVAHVRFNCTATAINDAKNNAAKALVLTAAHCFIGDIDGFIYNSDDWSFAPGWHNNKDPYGLWEVKEAYYPTPWYTCNGITGLCTLHGPYDYAVFIVKPQHGHGVGYYTGQDGWRVNMPKTENVTVFGVPGTSSTMLVNSAVSHTVTIGGYQYRRVATPNFGDGASGGPWFYSYSFSSELGDILGDTGGYDAGGPTDSPSYSPVWTTYFSGFVATVAKKE
jgi:V8-like Glu-specific endopeptidase